MTQFGSPRARLRPGTGTNEFGVPLHARADSVQFGYSTSASPEATALGHAQRLLNEFRWFSACHPGENERAAWIRGRLEQTRQSLAKIFQLPEGSELFFAPAGTYAEMLASWFGTLGNQEAALVAIIPGLNEVGRGCGNAVLGEHPEPAAPSGRTFEQGGKLEGFPGQVTCPSIPIRDSLGAPIPLLDIEAAIQKVIREAKQLGQRVLLHQVFGSKTGRIVPSPGFVQRMQNEFPGQVDVVVDACQLWHRPSLIGEWVENGYMVMVTGSKYLGGPSLSGGIAIPKDIAARAAGKHPPAGFQDYIPRGLVPNAFANKLWPEAEQPLDLIGPLLRWWTALHALTHVPDNANRLRSERVAAVRAVLNEASGRYHWLDMVDVPERTATLTTFTFRVGNLSDPTSLKKLHTWLQSQGIFLGQPVPLCPEPESSAALRIAIGAAHLDRDPADLVAGVHRCLQAIERYLTDLRCQ